MPILPRPYSEAPPHIPPPPSMPPAGPRYHPTLGAYQPIPMQPDMRMPRPQNYYGPDLRGVPIRYPGQIDDDDGIAYESDSEDWVGVTPYRLPGRTEQVRAQLQYLHERNRLAHDIERNRSEWEAFENAGDGYNPHRGISYHNRPRVWYGPNEPISMGPARREVVNIPGNEDDDLEGGRQRSRRPIRKSKKRSKRKRRRKSARA